MTPAWRATSRPGAILAVLALAVALVVPPGFMPGPGGRLALCGGDGPAMAAMAMGKTTPGNRPAHGHASACPFAGHGAATTLAAAPMLASTDAKPGCAVEISLVDLVPGRGLAAPPPPPRGPPIAL